MSDVLDALTPIGPATRPDVTQLSTPEKRRRVQRVASNRDAAHFNAHVAVHAEAQAAKNARGALTGLKPVMSLELQQRLASAIAKKFGSKLLKRDSDQRLTPSASKQYAAAWGIATDKLTILQGRPTQILRVEEAEAQRPAVLELVRKLARVRGNQTPVQSEQRPTGENAG